MSKLATTLSVPTVEAHWLVFKGMALQLDFHGKDFDAAPVDSSYADLEARIASTLSREADDLELNVKTARRRAVTLGCAELPPRQLMGLQVYVVMATLHWTTAHSSANLSACVVAIEAQ